MSQSTGRNGKQRPQFAPEEKATVLRRHLVDRVPVSDLCDEYHLRRTLFYLWTRSHAAQEVEAYLGVVPGERS